MEAMELEGFPVHHCHWMKAVLNCHRIGSIRYAAPNHHPLQKIGRLFYVANPIFLIPPALAPQISGRRLYSQAEARLRVEVPSGGRKKGVDRPPTGPVAGAGAPGSAATKEAC